MIFNEIKCHVNTSLGLVGGCRGCPRLPATNHALPTVTGCLRPPPADNLSILASIQPAEVRRKGATLSLAHRAMKPGHLLHSALTCASGVNARHLKSRHPFVPAAQQLIVHLTTTEVWHSGRITNGMWKGWRALRDPLLSTATHSPAIALPRTVWVQFNCLRINIGRFRSCLHKWGMASSATCECGAEEQIVDHVVLQCLIHRPPHGLHDLTVLDDETIEWLLNTCPDIWCGQAVV